MNDLAKAVKRFLESASYEVSETDKGPFVLIAQNRYAIVLVVDARAGIRAAVEATLGLLVRPFRMKVFGPKTLEMYAVFLASSDVALDDVERYEQDTRICRKIVVREIQEIETRLSLLRPIDPTAPLGPDIESVFWSELNSKLHPNEVKLLRNITGRSYTVEELIDLLKDS